MSDDVFGTHKMTDALPPTATDAPHLGGKPEPNHATTAEQQREEQEGRQAHDNQGGVRDRLVDIGKANHMAGRGNGRVSDQ